MNILTSIIPGIVAVFGNIIFYIIVKSRIEKSIERHKISYAGIYKEKIEIHKEILRQLFQLKSKIQRYQYSGEHKLVLARKRQLLRWACLQNSHLRKVNSCFSVIARLALDAFLSSTPKKQEFSC